MVHDTPQLNSVAKQLNHTLVERIWVFTHSSGLPKFLWGEALCHATWLKNRTATRALDGRTPYQALFGRPPDLSALQPWGTTVWVHDANGMKLDARAREGRWLGLILSHTCTVYTLRPHAMSQLNETCISARHSSSRGRECPC